MKRWYLTPWSQPSHSSPYHYPKGIIILKSRCFSQYLLRSNISLVLPFFYFALLLKTYDFLLLKNEQGRGRRRTDIWCSSPSPTCCLLPFPFLPIALTSRGLLFKKKLITWSLFSYFPLYFPLFLQFSIFLHCNGQSVLDVYGISWAKGLLSMSGSPHIDFVDKRK